MTNQRLKVNDKAVWQKILRAVFVVNAILDLVDKLFLENFNLK